MLAMAQAGSTILGPPLAAFLLGLVDMVGVMLLDVASFVVAVGALLLVHVPEWARVLEDWRLVVYGVAMLAMILAAPFLLIRRGDVLPGEWPVEVLNIKPRAECGGGFRQQLPAR